MVTVGWRAKEVAWRDAMTRRISRANASAIAYHNHSGINVAFYGWAMA